MFFVSTGGMRENTGLEAVRKLSAIGLDAIELSGRVPDESQLQGLKVFSGEIKFLVHHYFPPPNNPFVLNLASLNKDIANSSRDHMRKAIRWCVELESPVYSFHGGYLLDPRSDELGRKISKKPIFNRGTSLKLFIERVNDLAEFARKEGIELLIENNVLSRENFSEFGLDPLLMTDPDECVEVMKKTPSNVNMLLDVGHLKVAANTLGYDPVSMVTQCDKWIKGYHLSENDGLVDSNDPVRPNSWFWPYIKKEVLYCCLEVYTDLLDTIVQQKNLVNIKLLA